MKVKNFLRAVARFARAKEGVSALEYAIVVGVVVAGVGGAVVAFSGLVEDEIDEIGAQLSGASGTVPAPGVAPTP